MEEDDFDFLMQLAEESVEERVNVPKPDKPPQPAPPAPPATTKPPQANATATQNTNLSRGSVSITALGAAPKPEQPAYLASGYVEQMSGLKVGTICVDTETSIAPLFQERWMITWTC